MGYTTEDGNVRVVEMEEAVRIQVSVPKEFKGNVEIKIKEASDSPGEKIVSVSFRQEQEYFPQLTY